MTKSQFLTRWPEFATADVDFPGMIDAALVEASAAMGDQWGDLSEQVHGLETAHRLAIGPFGRDAKLSTDDGMTTYGTQLARLRVAAMALLMRLG